MPRRALRLTVLTIATTTWGLGSFVPAMADDTPPPVAGDDSITVEARTLDFGGVSFIDVLANDSAAEGETLEICRVQAPERGLSVAEVQPNGNFSIQTPTSGVGVSGDGTVEEGAHESLVVLPWANRAGTYQFTYWACDTQHLTPATVTVTVEKTPVITVRKVDRPGRLRFTNPRTSRAVVIYGGIRQERPEGRVRLAPGSSETRRVEHRAVRWIAFAPRTGQVINEGVVRGIRLPGAARTSGAPSGAEPRLTAGMLRAWHRS
ncbi:Ig-like domain-containing protein [Nocardioides sp.]|uniref:Ig-like domain-containing protein n=1 Tax=Nocardioides sp. TaxID=35761 RepID=UPI002719B70B|nr:Ig-like domain-containing protein [Nocardioides sp.]MDO9455645.1 Ig-like domain-containing protein [Nocardioides sp.]